MGSCLNPLVLARDVAWSWLPRYGEPPQRTSRDGQDWSGTVATSPARRCRGRNSTRALPPSLDHDWCQRHGLQRLLPARWSMSGSGSSPIARSNNPVLELVQALEVGVARGGPFLGSATTRLLDETHPADGHAADPHRAWLAVVGGHTARPGCHRSGARKALRAG